LNLREIARQTLSSMRAHKMRSFLTMFGIIWTMARSTPMLRMRRFWSRLKPRPSPTSSTTEVMPQEIAQFSIALQVILGLIGALTLGVGGVGVMNIMLVSVTERTRETSPVVLTASFLILAAVGVVSGFWPALKAAQMEPVEALRYE
jgi:hypothetical protein